jgi:iron(III) transport system ATP-binding protein
LAEIRIKGLRKTYGETTALDDIDLDIADGEVMALLGPSGCGKTTTLQLLAGFLNPDAGEIWVGDRRVSAPSSVVPPERRHMSLIFQSYAVWPHKTVAQNVAFGLEVRHVSRTEIKERVATVLETVRMGHLAERYPSELSGGQQQRVALARALVVEPDILLLDEPLSNLDANLREEMRFEIRRLHEQTGITMVYVTHDQSEAMVTADRIAVMNHGRIEQVGPPEEIYEKPRTRFVAAFIGRTNTLPGVLVEPGLVDCSGIRIKGEDDSGASPGSDVVVSIRPHQVKLGQRCDNRTSGKVVRATYTGEARDYLIQLEKSAGNIRVLTPPFEVYEAGSTVEVGLPSTHCRIVAG